MNIHVLNENYMPLLGRKRVTFEVEHLGSATPSRQSLKDELSKKYNVGHELIAIRIVSTQFGMNKSKVEVHIYDDANVLKMLEPPKGKKSEPKKKEVPAK